MEKVGLYTNKSMVLTGESVETADQVIDELGKLALDNGCIEALFITAVKKREKEYPTGLPTVVPIAIPHIHDGCLRSFFSMAVLKEPVIFRCMGDPEEEIPVQLVFLFGITDPVQQTEVLKKFSAMFQNKEFLDKLSETENEEKALELMKEILGDYLVME